jgi:hypothetical protein
MAMTCSLVVGGDFISDVKSLSLLNNTAGFTLLHNGYAPGMALDGIVSDVLTVKVTGTSADNLAVNLQTLEEYFQRARWAVDAPERYHVWLRMKATNETNTRQTLVVGGSHGDKVGFYSHPVPSRNVITNYPIVVDRLPVWEAIASMDPAVVGLSSVGGHAAVLSSPSLNIVGDVPARIGYTGVAGSAGLTEFWWGFRTARFGTLANFVSPWECELGTATSDDVDITTDTTASPGGGGNTKMLCTFATSSVMTTRFKLPVAQISASYYEDLRGTFNIIARMKVDTGFSTRVRIAGGLGTTLSYNDAVAVTATAWTFYDLGRITLPVGGKAAYSFMQNCFIQFEAQRIAGTLAGGTGLHIDCLVPIPVNEGCAHISGGTGVQNELFVNSLGQISCNDYTSTSITGLASTTGTNPGDYFMPLGYPIVVMAAQRAAGSTLADTVNMGMKCFYRYRTMRGNV